MRRTAEILRQKRELQLASRGNGLLDPFEARLPLINYAESLAEDVNAKNPLPKSLPYLRKFAGELGEEVKRAFLFGCMTGLRISDIQSLVWGEIGREPYQLLKQQGKTKRVVSVPLNESAWKIINDEVVHRRDELVFPRLAASKANTNQYLKTWAKSAKVDKPFSWHTARRTFATLSLEDGADFATVSRLLGLG
jgi:integrase